MGCQSGIKFPVSVIGPFIVTFAGLTVPLNEPAPLPVQLLKMKPLFGDAETLTVVPLLCQPLAGLTVPFPELLMVRKCCVMKSAVNVVLDVGVTVCEIAPPSLHLSQMNCVPVTPLCGVVVPIVWLLLGRQLKACV